MNLRKTMNGWFMPNKIMLVGHFFLQMKIDHYSAAGAVNKSQADDSKWSFVLKQRNRRQFT